MHSVYCWNLIRQTLFKSLVMERLGPNKCISCGKERTLVVQGSQSLERIRVIGSGGRMSCISSVWLWGSLALGSWASYLLSPNPISPWMKWVTLVLRMAERCRQSLPGPAGATLSFFLAFFLFDGSVRSIIIYL